MKEKKLSILKSTLKVLMIGLAIISLLIIYPIWRMFVWIVNLVGIKGIRNINGNLETPVVFYEHPKTKRRVVFVATIHLAEAEYFVALQRLIDSLSESGYQVLFEGVGALSPQEEQALTEKERGVARMFDHLFKSVRKIGEMMSLQHQKEGLTYDSSWINTDITMYSLIRLFARHDVSFLKEGLDSLLKKEGDKEQSDDLSTDESEQMFFKWLINKLLSRFVPLVVIIGACSFFSRNRKLIKKFILDTRNEEAVRGINAHLTEGDVMTIWGAAHLKEIEKRLKQAGFREVRREWFTAYRVRDYRLIEFSVSTGETEED